MFYIPSLIFLLFFCALFYYPLCRIYPTNAKGYGKRQDNTPKDYGKGCYHYARRYLKLLKGHGKNQHNEQKPRRFSNDISDNENKNGRKCARQVKEKL